MPSHISRVDAQLTDKRCIAFRYAEPSLTERRRTSQWHSGEWSTELVGGTSCRLSNECVFLTRHNGQKRKGEHTGQGHPSPVFSHIFFYFSVFTRLNYVMQELSALIWRKRCSFRAQMADFVRRVRHGTAMLLYHCNYFVRLRVNCYGWPNLQVSSP